MIDHTDQHTYDLVIALVKCQGLFADHIAAVKNKFNPHLSFSGLALSIREFADECFLVTSFAQCLGQIRACRARRSTRLISQRVRYHSLPRDIRQPRAGYADQVGRREQYFQPTLPAADPDDWP
jgi:hypothetical protein